MIVARMIPSRKAHDILLGHLSGLLELGGVPRKGVYAIGPQDLRDPREFGVAA